MQYSFGRHEHRIETPRFDPTFSNTSRAAAHSLTLWKFFHLILTLVMSLPKCVLKRLGDDVASTIALKHAFFEQIEVIRSGKKVSHSQSSYATLFHEILFPSYPSRRNQLFA